MISKITGKSSILIILIGNCAKSEVKTAHALPHPGSFEWRRGALLWNKPWRLPAVGVSFSDPIEEDFTPSLSSPQFPELCVRIFFFSFGPALVGSSQFRVNRADFEHRVQRE